MKVGAGTNDIVDHEIRRKTLLRNVQRRGQLLGHHFLKELIGTHFEHVAAHDRDNLAAFDERHEVIPKVRFRRCHRATLTKGPKVVTVTRNWVAVQFPG